ncbi:MAG: DNA polymerase III subunit delta [Variibacter sp.]|nr:DNA polymerase III subunit delta [Variibacter sp.]
MTVIKAADAFAARPDPAYPIVLVYGPDSGLVSERAQTIIAASVDDPRDPFAVALLNGDELASDPARLADEAQAVPMFGGRRAVRVRAGARSFLPALEALLAAPLRECRVVIEAGDLKRSAPLRTTCEKARAIAVIACYADEARALAALIDEEMRAAGLAITAEARAALLPLRGGDRRASRNELSKIALYAHGKSEVAVEDVEAVVGDASGVLLDQALDAAFAGKTREAEAHFSKAIAEGSAPGAVVGAALRQAAQLHKLRLAVDGGVAPAQAIGQGFFFRRKDAWESALRKWSSPRLAAVLAELGDTALAIRLNPALAEGHARRVLLRIAMAGR